MRAIRAVLRRLSLFISAVCIVAMTAIITYQVVARYGFNNSPAWSERLSLVLLAYLVFFGAAAGIYEKFHIRIDFFRNAVPSALGRVFEAVAHLAVAGAGMIMMVAGFQLATNLWDFALPALGIPRGVALLPISIAGGLITVFALYHLSQTVTAGKEEVR